MLRLKNPEERTAEFYDQLIATNITTVSSFDGRPSCLSLNLSEQKLTTGDCRWVAQAIKRYQENVDLPLRSLNLSKNYFQYCSEEIIGLLSQHKELTIIYLNRCNLEIVDLIKIVDSLQGRETLNDVILLGNRRIDSLNDQNLFLDALSRTNITSIELQKDSGKDDFINRIDEVLERNFNIAHGSESDIDISDFDLSSTESEEESEKELDETSQEETPATKKLKLQEAKGFNKEEPQHKR